MFDVKTAVENTESRKGLVYFLAGGRKLKHMNMYTRTVHVRASIRQYSLQDQPTPYMSFEKFENSRTPIKDRINFFTLFTYFINNGTSKRLGLGKVHSPTLNVPVCFWSLNHDETLPVQLGTPRFLSKLYLKRYLYWRILSTCSTIMYAIVKSGTLHAFSQYWAQRTHVNFNCCHSKGQKLGHRCRLRE